MLVAQAIRTNTRPEHGSLPIIIYEYCQPMPVNLVEKPPISMCSVQIFEDESNYFQRIKTCKLLFGIIEDIYPV